MADVVATVTNWNQGDLKNWNNITVESVKKELIPNI